MTRVVFAAILLAAGCQGGAETAERFQGATAEGFSCELPTSWTSARDRGSVVFTTPAHPRRTVVVRSIPRSERGTDAAFLSAADMVMNGLPAVELASKRSLTGALAGVRYELTFVPPGMSERFTRTHVVILGETRVFHVIETEPASGESHDELVTRVVASFREEV